MTAWRARAALLVLAIAVAALAVSSVRLDTATADEGAHIAAGLIKLRHGWLSFFPEQPPLMNVLSALPLGEFTMPDVWQNDLGRGGHWRAGHALLYGAGNDAHRLLFLARLPTVALFLALCFAVYRVVASEAGRTWGVIAFALTGFCPNLLAHGRLATVDMALTAFGFISFAFLLRAVKSRSVVAGAFCGFFAMCAVLSKASGVLIPPFLLIAAALHIRKDNNWRPLVRPAVAAFAAAVVLLYAITFGLASDAYLGSAWRDTPRVLVPWLQYKQHVDAIRFWYAAGHEHTQFLLGQFSPNGWPHYYFVAFFLKTPVGAILLLVMALVAARRSKSLAMGASFLFVALFFAVSMTSHIDLGLRYVLPIYPFLYTAIAIALATVVTEKRRAIATGVLVAWHCVSSLSSYPSYISYFNELIGGNRNADRFLIDSNLDWGQDLRRLRLWCDENGVSFIRLDYFGGGEPAYEFGNRAERFPAPAPQLLPKGWFAVSRHFYRVSFDPRESHVDYDTYLAASKARYVTTVGGSIDVYHVD
ncbi:MAG TPA: glycosyltransferase family 39 protein [Thermoanaerobaculia bacterium]|nr:glycosyltransferase family 39 protein [Thermoanaerobaculia bacterium]